MCFVWIFGPFVADSADWIIVLKCATISGSRECECVNFSVVSLAGPYIYPKRISCSLRPNRRYTHFKRYFGGLPTYIGRVVDLVKCVFIEQPYRHSLSIGAKWRNVPQRKAAQENACDTVTCLMSFSTTIYGYTQTTHILVGSVYLYITFRVLTHHQGCRKIILNVWCDTHPSEWQRCIIPFTIYICNKEPSSISQNPDKMRIKCLRVTTPRHIGWSR